MLYSLIFEILSLSRSLTAFQNPGGLAPRHRRPELPKAADVQRHICTKFSRICAHSCLLSATVVKMALIPCFWHNLTKFSFNLTCFMAFSGHVSAQNSILKTQSSQKILLLEGLSTPWTLDFFSIQDDMNAYIPYSYANQWGRA